MMFFEQVPSVEATLPDITVQEVSLSGIVGHYVKSFYFHPNGKIYLVTWYYPDYPSTVNRTCRVYYTTDIGNTTPTWTFLGQFPINITTEEPYVTLDESFLYISAYNWTGKSESIVCINLTDFSDYREVVHPDVQLFLTYKLHHIVEINGVIYVGSYVDNHPIIANTTIGSTTFGTFANLTETIHLHGLSYSNVTNRLYFAHDNGAGYFDLSTGEKHYLVLNVTRAETDNYKRVYVNEVVIGGKREILVGSDVNTTYIERYSLSGDYIGRYYLENYTSGNDFLHTPFYVYGDKVFGAGSCVGTKSFNVGIYVLNLFDKTWKWLINGTHNFGVPYSGQIGNYLYFAGNLGSGYKLWMINLTEITQYDYKQNNIELRYLAKGKISSFTFTDQRLHVTLDAPSGTISTLTVYCGDYGEPEYIYVEPDSELVSWSYNVSTSLLTVQVKHGSPANITISWVSTPSGGVVPSKIRSQIVLDTATLSVKPNETVVVSGRLLDEFYNPIPNGKLTVTFLWNGSKITVYSDVDGRFTFTFKAPSEKGRYAVHIYFAGDTTHSSAEKIYRFYVGPPIGLPIPLNLPSLPPTQTLILTAVFAAYIYLKKRRGKNA